MTRIAFILLLLVLTPAIAQAQSGDDVSIESASLEVVPGARTATATGGVTIRSARFEATATEAEATYAATTAGTGTRRVERLVLRGDVKARRSSDGLESTAQEATYLAADGVLVLTGDPVVTRGRDRLRGTKITLGLDGDRLEAAAARLRVQRHGAEKAAELRADRLVVDDGGKRAKFDGNVGLREGELSATAEHMDARLSGRTGLAPGASAGEVERVGLTGDVRATRGETKASAGEATWDAASGDLVLTKEPLVTNETGAVKGARIVVRGDTGAARVESAVARVKTP